MHQSRRFQQLEAPGELAPSEQTTFEAPVWPDVLPRPLLTGDYMVTGTQRENDGKFSRTPLPLPPSLSPSPSPGDQTEEGGEYPCCHCYWPLPFYEFSYWRGLLGGQVH